MPVPDADWETLPTDADAPDAPDAPCDDWPLLELDEAPVNGGNGGGGGKIPLPDAALEPGAEALAADEPPCPDGVSDPCDEDEETPLLAPLGALELLLLEAPALELLLPLLLAELEDDDELLLDEDELDDACFPLDGTAGDDEDEEDEDDELDACGGGTGIGTAEPLPDADELEGPLLAAALCELDAGAALLGLADDAELDAGAALLGLADDAELEGDAELDDCDGAEPEDAEPEPLPVSGQQAKA